MATDLGSIAQLGQLAQSMLLGSKSTVTRKASPAATAQFNQIMQSLSPQLQGQVVSQADLDAMLQAILGKAKQDFAPTRNLQRQAGAYNSTASQALENDAMAKATNEAMQTMINAKLASAQQQTNAANVAGNVAANYGQLTGSTTTETPAALGDLALPAALYAGYKFFTGDGVDDAVSAVSGAPAVGKAAGSVADAGAAASVVSPVITGGVPTGGPTLANLARVKDSLGGIGGLDTQYLGDLQSAGDLGAGSIISGLDSTLLSTSPISTGGDLFSGSLDSILTDPIAGTADAISNISADGGSLGGISGASDALGGIVDSIGGAVRSIPGVGNAIADAGGAIGDTVGKLNSAMTIDTGIDVPGLKGIPVMSGIGNFLQGDFKGGAKEIAITMALNAIPVVGPVLNIARGIGKIFKKCYITTAVTEATGGPDDAYELETLRKYRDEFMLATPAGQELVANYYEVAPRVVEKLDSREDAKEIYTHFYSEYILPAVKQIENGDNYGALETYRKMSEYAERLANEGEQHANA